MIRVFAALQNLAKNKGRKWRIRIFGKSILILSRDDRVANRYVVILRNLSDGRESALNAISAPIMNIPFTR